MVFVWLGGGVNRHEVELSQKIAERLGRMHHVSLASDDSDEEDVECDPVMTLPEGHESPEFWHDIGGRGLYANDSLLKDPELSVHAYRISFGSGRLHMEEVARFCQWDLHEDAFLLDCGREVFIRLPHNFGERLTGEVMKAARDYVAAAPKPRDVHYTVVEIDKEPPSFTCHFHGWVSDHKFGFEDPRACREKKLKVDQSATRRAMRTALKGSKCSFAVTGANPTVQKFYTCVTCAISAPAGVCLTCAEVCHKGHSLAGPIEGASYCMCGALTVLPVAEQKERPPTCRCIAPDTPLPPIVEIPSVPDPGSPGDRKKRQAARVASNAALSQRAAEAAASAHAKREAFAREERRCIHEQEKALRKQHQLEQAKSRASQFLEDIDREAKTTLLRRDTTREADERVERFGHLLGASDDELVDELLEDDDDDDARHQRILSSHPDVASEDTDDEGVFTSRGKKEKAQQEARAAVTKAAPEENGAARNTSDTTVDTVTELLEAALGVVRATSGHGAMQQTVGRLKELATKEPSMTRRTADTLLARAAAVLSTPHSLESWDVLAAAAKRFGDVVTQKSGEQYRPWAVDLMEAAFGARSIVAVSNVQLVSALKASCRYVPPENEMSVRQRTLAHLGMAS